jgi:hypothetical protein
MLQDFFPLLFTLRSKRSLGAYIYNIFTGPFQNGKMDMFSIEEKI